MAVGRFLDVARERQHILVETDEVRERPAAAGEARRHLLQRSRGRRLARPLRDLVGFDAEGIDALGPLGSGGREVGDMAEKLALLGEAEGFRAPGRRLRDERRRRPARKEEGWATSPRSASNQLIPDSVVATSG